MTPSNSQQPDPAPPKVDSLQFHTADIVEKKAECAQCGAVLEDEYYHVGGLQTCPSCAEAVRNQQQRPKQSWVMRGSLYGLAAAIGCAILYALIVWVTNYELALMAILVGYVVGKAVRQGSRGHGGRRCQLVAVALTYFAITSSYVPILYKGMQQRAQAGAKKESGKPADAPPPQRNQQPVSASGVILSVGLLLLIALAAPFLTLTQGFSGILGLVIIFFGLQRAWSLTARDERLLMGPYRLKEDAPVAGTA